MLFLHDIQSPVNMGLVLRAGEQFQIPVALYDPRQVLSNPQSLKTIQDFSCGAIDRTPPELVTSLADFRTTNRARVIATCLNDDAIPLHEFDFRSSDIILLGNEYDGLPQDVIDNADESLYISLPPAFVPKPRSHSPIDPARSAAVAQNGVPNLNVATCAAIIAYVYRTQYPVGVAQSTPSQIKIG